MPNLFLIPVVTTIIVFVLFLLERKKRLTLERQSDEVALQEARKKSMDMLEEAGLKAQTILAQAVQEGMALTKKQDGLEKVLIEDMLKKFDQALSQYAVFLSSIREKTSESLNARTQQVFDRFEQTLSDFLVQTQQKSTHAVELEMQAARNLIDTYRKQQLNLIDDQIVQVLERTLSLVLAKKMSLQDQVELINEALEKAKVEKFIF